MTMMKKLFLFLVYAFAAFGILLTVVFFAVKFGLTNGSGIIDSQRNAFLKEISVSEPIWTEGEEWAVLKEAIIRDREALNRAGAVSDIS
ncbi:MAG: hypothetical protein AAB899_01555, partial [Patescibacteria group bacterium]